MEEGELLQEEDMDTSRNNDSLSSQYKLNTNEDESSSSQIRGKDTIFSITDIKASRMSKDGLEVQISWKSMDIPHKIHTTWEKVKDLVGEQLETELRKRYLTSKQNVFFPNEEAHFQIRQKEMHRTSFYKDKTLIGSGYCSLLSHSVTITFSKENTIFKCPPSLTICSYLHASNILQQVLYTPSREWILFGFNPIPGCKEEFKQFSNDLVKKKTYVQAARVDKSFYIQKDPAIDAVIFPLCNLVQSAVGKFFAEGDSYEFYFLVYK